jgi:hypothetical protein
MTQEEKLLLKDLCGRIPYGVKVVDLEGWQFTVKGIDGTFPLVDKYTRFGNTYYTVGYGWKPYLRPMSSMTDEEANEWAKASNMKFDMEDGFIDAYDAHLSVDWLNAHHFDYRGLIPMGLALEAPKDMYNVK